LPALILPLFEQLLFALYSVKRITQQSDGYTAGKRPNDLCRNISAHLAGIDWTELFHQQNTDQRVGLRFLYSASCSLFPKHRSCTKKTASITTAF
jgi:hypothetical protein